MHVNITNDVVRSYCDFGNSPTEMAIREKAIVESHLTINLGCEKYKTTQANFPLFVIKVISGISNSLYSLETLRHNKMNAYFSEQIGFYFLLSSFFFFLSTGFSARSYYFDLRQVNKSSVKVHVDVFSLWNCVSLVFWSLYRCWTTKLLINSRRAR